VTTPPPLSLPFRIATYSTLLLACVALGYSEYDLVPESIAFMVVVVVSLIASFFLEGRLALGLGKANLLGLGIGIVAVGWLAVKFSQPTSSALVHLAWPANLLPYIGPVVMILIPAKLFRPKHVGDWWTMQGIALASVVLASSMSDDPFFLVLVALYAFAATWSLSLLLSNCSTGAISPLPGKVGPRSEILPGYPSRNADGERGAWWRAALWLGAASLVSLPIFFLSPRSSGERWAFTKSRIETGYNPESSHDMGKVGDLDTNNSEIAFEVLAANRDGSAKNDFDPGQLWRGSAYSEYKNGSWARTAYASGYGARFRTAPPPAAYRAPDLGDTQYDLEFLGSEKVAGPVLSSPIFWADDQETPVSVASGTRQAWPPLYDGSFISPRFGARVRQHYVQRTRAPSEPGLGPAMEPSGSGTPALAEPERAVLTKMGIPRIREWAVELLKKYVADGRLPQATIDTADRRASFALHPDHHEAVARMFRDHFLYSGEFEYSTKLRRVDRKIDPIEDFLWNSKSGHCERFAAGLALALRSLGIAAQFVVGFKGCEFSEDGKILIRQEHAHAWVEVMVPRAAPAGFSFKNPENRKADRVWHWLTLDPTPGGATEVQKSGNWFDEARQKGVSFLNDFIIGYNPKKREEAVEAVSGSIVDGSLYFFGAVGAIAFLLALRRRIAQRRRDQFVEPQSELPWYRDYLAVLRDYGQFPAAGETPKEFADRVGEYLRSTPAASSAALPAFVSSKLYRVRYAGSSLAASEESDIAAAVAALADALKSLPNR